MPRLTRSPSVVLPLAIAGVAHATRRLRLLSYGPFAVVLPSAIGVTHAT
jgi:hypothetical protein